MTNRTLLHAFLVKRLCGYMRHPGDLLETKILPRLEGHSPAAEDAARSRLSVGCLKSGGRRELIFGHKTCAHAIR